jgi:hypothetical protein
MIYMRFFAKTQLRKWITSLTIKWEDLLEFSSDIEQIIQLKLAPLTSIGFQRENHQVLEPETKIIKIKKWILKIWNVEFSNIIQKYQKLERWKILN